VTGRRLLPRAVEHLLPALTGARVWIVGGSVRDVLLDRASPDVDFVVDGDALALGRRLANEAGADYFELDSERGTGRMLLTTGEGSRTVFDFARLQGGSIEADLRLRDFTVDAMAVSLDDPERLVDPLGGLDDLHQRRLRACSTHAVLDDPVRALRAVRIAAELEARMTPDTVSQVRGAHGHLRGAPPERTRNEFFKMLRLESPAAALRNLDHLGLLTMVLPELEGLRGLAQPPAHAYDALTHTLAVVDALERLKSILPPEADEDRSSDLSAGMAIQRLGRFRKPLSAYFDVHLSVGRSRWQCLLLAGLLHDVGKARTQAVDADGQIRFLGHETVGAAMAVEACRRLSLSLAETSEIETIVAHHLRPEWLEKEPPVSRRAVYRFFRATGSTGVGVAILSLADLHAKHVPPVPQEAWSARLDIVRELLEAWFERREDRVMPSPLLDGKDVMRLANLTPGPTVGALLEDLREAQAGGEVASRAEAEEFVRFRSAERDAGDSPAQG
jgi:putative nucleotidyltransferase with HDIG domain